MLLPAEQLFLVGTTSTLRAQGYGAEPSLLPAQFLDGHSAIPAWQSIPPAVLGAVLISSFGKQPKCFKGLCGRVEGFFC